ncbi:MAG: gamma-glutamyl-gamma-aminobutyrate hydrolase family protein [Streptosporangiales bacterium]|nr:gamma-glutamyl-gamma-aminobutyrate hydrolase family protein [Streptosporangiales bacterium]
MPRPLIGITSHLEPARWGDWVREAVLSPAPYTRAVERAGGTPVVLPPLGFAGAGALVTRFDALILADGGPVGPGLYGADPQDADPPPDGHRDRFEIALVRAAAEAGIPFLAVSRGLHVLNVARGGTLIQDLPGTVGHDAHAPDPVKPGTHAVAISPSSRLGRALGATASVPTAHRQAVQRLGKGLMAVAWADDQIVEAVELQGHPFGLGVQWNAEEAGDLRIFTALTEAAERRAPARAG